MSGAQDAFGIPESAAHIPRSRIEILKTIANKLANTVSENSENAPIDILRFTVKHISADVKGAWALSNSDVLDSEFKQHSVEADDARACNILAVDTLALLLSQAQPNDLARMA